MWRRGGVYRRSEAYLYNLTAFAMTATKLPYLEMMSAPSHQGHGCSTTAVASAPMGCCCWRPVTESSSPSSTTHRRGYLRWRLRRRGLEAPIHDLDRDVPAATTPPCLRCDRARRRPLRTARRARDAAPISSLVNLLESEPVKRALHRRCRSAGSCTARRFAGSSDYRILHGRSHLVAYRGNGDRAGVAGRRPGTSAACPAGACGHGSDERVRESAPRARPTQCNRVVGDIPAGPGRPGIRGATAGPEQAGVGHGCQQRETTSARHDQGEDRDHERLRCAPLRTPRLATSLAGRGDRETAARATARAWRRRSSPRSPIRSTA